MWLVFLWIQVGVNFSEITTLTCVCVCGDLWVCVRVCDNQTQPHRFGLKPKWTLWIWLLFVGIHCTIFLPLCCELPVLLFTLEYWITVRRCLDWLIVKIKLSFSVYWIGHLCSTQIASINHVLLIKKVCVWRWTWTVEDMHLVICLLDHVICKENLIYDVIWSPVRFFPVVSCYFMRDCVYTMHSFR